MGDLKNKLGDNNNLNEYSEVNDGNSRDQLMDMLDEVDHGHKTSNGQMNWNEKRYIPPTF